MEFIAEIGKNFITTKEVEGEQVLLGEAFRLIEAAKEAGADTAKFQVHQYHSEVRQIKFHSPHFAADRHTWVKRCTFSYNFWSALKKKCMDVDIGFLVTPMSMGAAVFVDSLVDRWKVSSADITDYPLLRYLAKTKKPIILSTGFSDGDELEKAVEFIGSQGGALHAILHCVSEYPCGPESANLSRIEYLKDTYYMPIGFSDHTVGINAALCAASLGASIIEKHFTMDRDSYGPDHKVSITKDMFALMVSEAGKGTVPDDCCRCLHQVVRVDNKKLKKAFKKGLFAVRHIYGGSKIERHDIVALRPIGDAVGAEEYDFIVGAIAERDFLPGDPINLGGLRDVA